MFGSLNLNLCLLVSAEPELYLPLRLVTLSPVVKLFRYRSLGFLLQVPIYTYLKGL